ncbi:hypothetical protein RI367_004069 [Sorochytrium milnesiophthora]
MGDPQRQPSRLQTKLFDFPPPQPSASATATPSSYQQQQQPSASSQQWVSFGDAQPLSASSGWRSTTSLSERRALFEQQQQQQPQQHHNPFAESPANVVPQPSYLSVDGQRSRSISENSALGNPFATAAVAPINPFASPERATPMSPESNYGRQQQHLPSLTNPFASPPAPAAISIGNLTSANGNAPWTQWRQSANAPSANEPPPVKPRPKLGTASMSEPQQQQQQQQQQAPPPVPARPAVPARPISVNAQRPAPATPPNNSFDMRSIQVPTVATQSPASPAPMTPPPRTPHRRYPSVPVLPSSSSSMLSSSPVQTPHSGFALPSQTELIPDANNVNVQPPSAADCQSVLLPKGPTIRAVLATANIIVTGHRDCTKIWHAQTGRMISQLNHPDLKVTAITLRPSHVYLENLYIAWLGFSNGEVWCVDLLGQIESPPSRIAAYTTTMGTVPGDLFSGFTAIYAPVVIERKKVSSSGHAIAHMIRFRLQLWTIDENDVLQIWTCPAYESLLAKRCTPEDKRALARDRFTMAQPAISLQSKPAMLRVNTLSHYSREMLGASAAADPSSNGGSSSSAGGAAPDANAITEIEDHHSITCIVPKSNNSCELWITHLKSAKQIDIFDPVSTTGSFAVRSLDVGASAGALTCMAYNYGARYVNTVDVVFTGHDDGKVIVWDAKGPASNRVKLHVVSVGSYKITSLAICTAPPPSASMGDPSVATPAISKYLLWVGYVTGKIQAFDVSVMPWICVKDFRAHKNSKGKVGKLAPVPPLRYVRSIDTPAWKLVSVSLWDGGGSIDTWDAGLTNDWMGQYMRSQEGSFAKYDPLHLLVLSWNLDASKPADLDNTPSSSSDDISLLSDTLDSDDQPPSRHNSRVANIPGLAGSHRRDSLNMGSGGGGGSGAGGGLSGLSSSSSSSAKFLNNWVGSARHLPDIIVVGFQETVDLESKKVQAKTIFKKKKRETETRAVMDAKQYKLWQEAITRAIYDHYSTPGSARSQRLPRPPSYRLVASQYMVGLFLLVFVRDEVMPRLSCVEVQEVKTGFGGYHGNKGSILTRLTVDDSSFCFCVAHLAAGQGQVTDRNKNLMTIFDTVEFSSVAGLSTSGSSTAPSAAGVGGAAGLSTSSNNLVRASAIGRDIDQSHKFKYGSDGRQILDHDNVFFFGDLNYRIELPRDTVVSRILENDWSYLQQYDQLVHQKQPSRTHFVLRPFYEGPLTFCPTYKYDPGTDRFDSSEKRRVPAWCDRILWRSDMATQEWYTRFEARISDHRPIGAEFTVHVKSEDARAKTHIREQAMQSLHALERQRWVASVVDMFRRWLCFDEPFLQSLERWIGSSSMGEDVGVDELMLAIWQDWLK